MTPALAIAGVEHIAKQRERVCAIAREWIATPYHHMGRIKGAGVDCAMFPLEVYREAGLIGDVEVPYYPQDWMLHRSVEVFLGVVERYAHEVKEPAAGDLVMYRFGRCFSHGGIVLAWPTILHALTNKGVVLADGEREGYLLNRPKRFFSIFLGSPDGPRLECP